MRLRRTDNTGSTLLEERNAQLNLKLADRLRKRWLSDGKGLCRLTAVLSFRECFEVVQMS